MGADVMYSGLVGDRREDVRHIFKSCFPSRLPLWIRDVGSDPPPQPDTRGVPRSGHPPVYGKAAPEAAQRYMGVPAHLRGSGGDSTGGCLLI